MFEILEINLEDLTPLLIPAIFGIFATWITAATQKRGAREHLLIDQLQEEKVAAQVEIASLKKEISEMKERKAILHKTVEDNHKTFQEHMEKVHKLLSHIWKLEQHILQELPPPPPPMED